MPHISWYIIRVIYIYTLAVLCRNEIYYKTIASSYIDLTKKKYPVERKKRYI